VAADFQDRELLHHNFAKPHGRLSKGTYPTTPAIAAGVANRVWSRREIAALLG
jgi:hypothetical protein